LTGAPGWAWPVVICVIAGLLAIDLPAIGLLTSRRAGMSGAVGRINP